MNLGVNERRHAIVQYLNESVTIVAFRVIVDKINH